jgi:uncharacterized protein (TIGR03790 family)
MAAMIFLRNGNRMLARLILLGALTMAGLAVAQSAEPAVPVQRQWVPIPRVQGHLTAFDLGVVINTADPYSVAVGEYYVQKRGIPQEQVLRVELPLRSSLNVAEFGVLYAQIRDFMGPQVQALALAWTQPFAVDCNSITSALTLGLEPEACRNGCAVSKPSRFFNSPSSRPFTDLGLRPSMLLASRSIESAQALIDRGVASDGSLGKRGAPPANAVFVNTADAARSVRTRLFPPAGPMGRLGATVVLANGATASPLRRVIVYQTGVTRENAIDNRQWLPGALADHLTSFGGQLLDGSGQMSVLEWLESGATASYGTVSEPCNHLQKFPHPQVLLLNYVQGATAIEAYWRSVAWPAQGVFVGEPLAAPFSRSLNR